MPEPSNLRPAHDVNKSFDIVEGNTGQPGKWSDELPVCLVSFPGRLSCTLRLIRSVVQDTYGQEHIDSVDVEAITDLRVVSLHTMIAWGIPVVLAVTLGIVGIINLLKSGG